jgi:ABC-type phosphate transport system substrate-binding protein
VPELGDHELVLDFQVIAAIYLNSITMWNDQRIRNLNTPQVAALLPARHIVVVTQSINSAVTRLFTAALSAQVPEFASTVTHLDPSCSLALSSSC